MGNFPGLLRFPSNYYNSTVKGDTYAYLLKKLNKTLIHIGDYS